jgi:hypothetical protein
MNMKYSEYTFCGLKLLGIEPFCCCKLPLEALIFNYVLHGA